MKEMKKTLLLTIIVFVLLLLSGCKKDTGTVSDLGKKPEPLGEADIYFYDKAGEKTDLNHIGFTKDGEFTTYRGLQPGDKAKTIAEKYDLSEFTVVTNDPNVVISATADNIFGEEFMDVSADFTVNGKRYSMSFTINFDEISMISVNPYPEQ